MNAKVPPFNILDEVDDPCYVIPISGASTSQASVTPEEATNDDTSHDDNYEFPQWGATIPTPEDHLVGIQKLNDDPTLFPWAPPTQGRISQFSIPDVPPSAWVEKSKYTFEKRTLFLWMPQCFFGSVAHWTLA